MAVTYDLIIIGDTSAEDFVARVYDDALPPPGLRALQQGPGGGRERAARLLAHAARRQRRLLPGRDWEIEPARYLDVEFRVDKDAEPKAVHANVRRFVDRALATGDEDMALINNSFTLLLERKDGEVRRVPSSFWDDWLSGLELARGHARDLLAQVAHLGVVARARARARRPRGSRSRGRCGRARGRSAPTRPRDSGRELRRLLAGA